MITAILSGLVALFKAIPALNGLVAQFVALHNEHEKQLAIQKAQANEIEALTRRDAKRADIDAAVALAITAVYGVPDNGHQQEPAVVPPEQPGKTDQAPAIPGSGQGGS